MGRPADKADGEARERAWARLAAMEQVKLAKAAKAAKADAKGKAKAEAQGMRKGRPSKASKGAPVEPEAVDKASVASLAAACESGLVVLVPPGWQDAAVGLVGANAVCAERTDELKRRLLSVVGRRRAEGTMQVRHGVEFKNRI